MWTIRHELNVMPDSSKGASKSAGTKKVDIYSTPTCHWCMLAKDFFRKNNVDFTDHNVAMDAKARDEMIQKTGQLGVPVIQIGSNIIIGFDREQISTLLGIKSAFSTSRLL